MFKLIVLLATVAYASAGLYSGYGGLYGYGGYGYGGYGLDHGVAIAPSYGYAHAPIATSYANTYKVALTPPITKVIAPTITKVAYTAPIAKVAYAPTYSTPSVNYGHYGYSIPPTVTYLNNKWDLGYGQGLGYGHNLGYGLGYGYGSGYGHGYGYGGYYH